MRWWRCLAVVVLWAVTGVVTFVVDDTWDALWSPHSPSAPTYKLMFESRDDMRRWRHRSRTQQRAVEIGTYLGDFASTNLQEYDSGGHQYTMVDPVVRPTLKKRLAQWSSNKNITFMQTTSTKAARAFPDGHFTWIYIDARHDLKSVSEDLEAWWPKLAPAGLFSGHDYCVGEGARNLARYRDSIAFCGYYGNAKKDSRRVGKPKASQQQSVDAVFAFAKRHHLPSMKTTMEGRASLDDAGRRNPSWYMIKPHNDGS